VSDEAVGICVTTNNESHYSKSLSKAKKSLESYCTEQCRLARIDELKHLGFDKRLDDPTLYCDGERVMSILERINELDSQQSSSQEGI
jgi:hypothetical protein